MNLANESTGTGVRRWRWIAGLIALAALAPMSAVQAADADRRCLMCHNETRWPQVHEIFATPHGTLTDARTPMAGDGCGSCHADTEQHVRAPTEHAPTSGVEACADCHRGDALHWESSVHAAEQLDCGSCHQVHAVRQAVLNPTTQARTCYQCHQDVRAQVNLPSRHPLREAEMTCSDCHAPHGSLKRASLTGINLNETCLTCHEAQRGPFLFDHPPASDDCSNCHEPHGAVHRPLLTDRAPQLCQQCHMANFHPSDLNAGGGLPGGVPNASLLGRNCLSCHPAVHGSNHPSGARLTR